MSGKARSACSGTTEANADPSKRPAVRCEVLTVIHCCPAAGTRRRSVASTATDNNAIGSSARGASHAVAPASRAVPVSRTPNGIPTRKRA